MSNEWLLTQREINKLREEALSKSPLPHFEETANMTAHAQLRKVAEMLVKRKKLLIGIPEHPPSYVRIQIDKKDWHSLFQEAGMEVKDA